MSNSMDILAREVVAYHFCQMDNEPTCTLPYFVHSVSEEVQWGPKTTYWIHLSYMRTAQIKPSGQRNIIPNTGFSTFGELALCQFDCGAT